MNRRRFQKFLLGAGVTGLCACTVLPQAGATSDFEGATWKQFEAKAAGRTIRFEFPVNVPGTTEFTFNTAIPVPFPSTDHHSIVFLRTNEHIGWVYATFGITVMVSITRYRGVNSDGSWAPYFEFSTMQNAFERISKNEPTNSFDTKTHSLIRFGHVEWMKTATRSTKSGSHQSDYYRTILSRDYLLGVWFGLGTRGEPDEARLSELRKVGERIVASVRIE